MNFVEREVDLLRRVGLDMTGDEVRARVAELVDIALGLHDHQVHVDGQRRALADGLEHRDTDADIGDEAAVHHVKVDVVGGGNGLDAGAELGKVGGEDGRCDLDGHDKNPPAKIFLFFIVAKRRNKSNAKKCKRHLTFHSRSVILTDVKRT